jgi:hypothetical protein
MIRIWTKKYPIIHRKKNKMIKFEFVWESVEELNKDKNKFFPSIPDMEQEEFTALAGRYWGSEIRYTNMMQFKFAFFSILVDALPRLRAKLRINERLRNLSVEEAMEGMEIITNVATNPDTSYPEPDEIYEPLEYVSSQSAQKEKQGIARGLFNWKHMVGGQSYNEFLDSFKKLFRVILSERSLEVIENEKHSI